MIKKQLRAISQSQVQNGTIVGPAFATIRELVARHGRAYTIRPLPRGWWSRKPQACYANALLAAIGRKWVYVEGFAIPKPGSLAVLHAWVTNPHDSGVAYDPTWACWARILWHSIQARLRAPHVREHRASWRSGHLGIGLAATPGR
jgi:hypothetical protein